LRGVVDAHLLVDAITSASASSGAAAAQPFTERRYEGGGGYTHEIDGPDGSYLDLARRRASSSRATRSSRSRTTSRGRTAFYRTRTGR
jgi:hypothetical protein